MFLGEGIKAPMNVAHLIFAALYKMVKVAYLLLYLHSLLQQVVLQLGKLALSAGEGVIAESRHIL